MSEFPSVMSRLGKPVSFLAALIMIMTGFEAGFAEENPGPPRGDLIVVIGAPGTEAYRDQFHQWEVNWSQAAGQGKCRVLTLGKNDQGATLDQLRKTLKTQDSAGALPLWIVLMGHGTFDGKTAKFNLAGEDLEPHMLAELLKPIQRPLAVILCAAASGPFVSMLSAPDRVVIAATTSGNEINFSRFGNFLAESIRDSRSDLDKDEQVSLLEAFLQAARRTEAFYVADGRLATEHACLDDNGDGRPVTATGFDGIRPIHRKQSDKLLPDGVLAHQWALIPGQQDLQFTPEKIAERRKLELELAALRERKSQLSEEDYYAALETIFLKLAQVTLEKKK